MASALFGKVLDQTFRDRGNRRCLSADCTRRRFRQAVVHREVDSLGERCVTLHIDDTTRIYVKTGSRHGDQLIVRRIEKITIEYNDDSEPETILPTPVDNLRNWLPKRPGNWLAWNAFCPPRRSRIWIAEGTENYPGLGLQIIADGGSPKQITSDLFQFFFTLGTSTNPDYQYEVLHVLIRISFNNTLYWLRKDDATFYEEREALTPKEGAQGEVFLTPEQQKLYFWNAEVFYQASNTWSMRLTNDDGHVLAPERPEVDYSRFILSEDPIMRTGDSGRITVLHVPNDELINPPL